MEAKIKTIPLARLSSGDDLTLQVYQFFGNPSGKKVYIQANLHGAEIVGNVVIRQLMSWLQSLDRGQLWGEVWLLPACNPLGMNQRSHFFSSGRYNPYDGKDWNRIFGVEEDGERATFAQKYLNSSQDTIYHAYLDHLKSQLNNAQSFQTSGTSYGVKYGNLLQSLCLDADIVIDLHSSSNEGINYLFTFPKQDESAKAFLLDVGLVVQQPGGYTFDEAFLKPWLSLEETFAQLGRSLNFNLESWTLELGGGMTANPQSVEKGVTGIKNYLAQKGVVNVSDFPLPETKDHHIYLADKSQLKKYYATTGGIIETYPPLRTPVKAGASLYQILEMNKKEHSPQLMTVTAEESGFIFDVGKNQAVNEGEYVLSVLETGDNYDA
ncbi:succinylglutamate desuccinylase/aspartoacylase family protein [Euhalothece natronophila Z-M001]|uniref:Succinylglutamate desuccinylase/aspartoacylase family protein n=1 Tax=Euhalothece natronophila Z-M001 TaxID=522448 RepID=A0A5B8NM71_9CHRO|nr:succinylglutamate desuccinylase/aspartoacylase family protein [Euhalothece natronophila]QDZ40392.1 succinylglutamate desuccinylase/aspartoacylase family protein [Euhalothece natronophila Z-M001]